MSLLQDLHRRFSKKTLSSDLPAAARRKAQQERQVSGQKEWREAYAATSKAERDERDTEWKKLSDGLLSDQDRSVIEKKLRNLTHKQNVYVLGIGLSLLFGAGGVLIGLAGAFITGASALLTPGIVAAACGAIGLVATGRRTQALTDQMSDPSLALQNHQWAKEHIENRLQTVAKNELGLEVFPGLGIRSATSVFALNRSFKTESNQLYARFSKQRKGADAVFHGVDPSIKNHIVRTAADLQAQHTPKPPLNFQAAVALLVSEAGMKPKDASRAFRRFNRKLSTFETS